MQSVSDRSPDLTPVGVPPLAGRDLLAATEPFATESRAHSWWSLCSTLLALGLAVTAAAMLPSWPLQLTASVLAALIMVRGFVLCHDFMHGTILRDSKLAKVLCHSFSTLLLVPPRSWRHSHNFHHGHVGKLAESSVGSFPIMTVQEWQQATPLRRFGYRLSRSPVTILGAYFSVFLLNICFASLLRDQRRHWDSAVTVAVHIGLIVALWLLFGPATMFFTYLLPLLLASALGAYLFYAQHNFPGVRILDGQDWTYHRAAVLSSSYLKVGGLMRWFTGAIGYHHVHHLNPRIPFYRLREAMAAIPELQQAVVTTLRPRDVLACLRLKLWDPVAQRMVGFAAARA